MNCPDPIERAAVGRIVAIAVWIAGAHSPALASPPAADAAQAVPLAPQASGTPEMLARVKLPRGAIVEMRTRDLISTRRAVKGDLAYFTIATDVVAQGQVLIPAGTTAVAEITRSDPKGAFGASGKLEMRMLYAQLPDRTVRLSGAVGSRGKGGTTETVLGVAAIGAFAFFITGKSAEIRPGTEVIGYIDRDIWISQPNPPADSDGGESHE